MKGSILNAIVQGDKGRKNSKSSYTPYFDAVLVVLMPTKIELKQVSRSAIRVINRWDFVRGVQFSKTGIKRR